MICGPRIQACWEFPMNLVCFWCCTCFNDVQENQRITPPGPLKSVRNHISCTPVSRVLRTMPQYKRDHGNPWVKSGEEDSYIQTCLQFEIWNLIFKMCCVSSLHSKWPVISYGFVQRIEDNQSAIQILSPMASAISPRSGQSCKLPWQGLPGGNNEKLIKRSHFFPNSSLSKPLNNSRLETQLEPWKPARRNKWSPVVTKGYVVSPGFDSQIAINVWQNEAPHIYVKTSICF